MINITNLNTEKIKRTLFTILETVLLSRVLAIYILFEYLYMGFFKISYFIGIYVYSLIPEIIIRYMYRKNSRKKNIIRIYKILLHLGVFCIYLLIGYGSMPYDLLRKLYIGKILRFASNIVTSILMLILPS